VNGEKFAGEIHFVHRHRRTKQLAVLGIFMQSHAPTKSNHNTARRRQEERTILNTQKATSNEWERYFTAAGVLKSTDNTTVMSLNLSALLGTNLNHFWRYTGSLTTPPCTEGIIWTMFQTPMNFTHTQLASFRNNIYFEDYRGPQPLNDRIVYRNFKDNTPSLISDYACCEKKPNAVADDSQAYA